MFKKLLSLMIAAILMFTFVSCTSGTNEGIENITKDNIKIGVIHIGDPADGTGYSYAHDQGIIAMQKNLGLKDSQIVRKLNIEDDNPAKIKESIEACIAEGCNVIFGTSYGYMDSMESLAEKYPNVIFSHGTGYKSNETNFNNYFGRIYQARYLAGIAAGLKTLKQGSTKIGYVSAFGTELAETSSGINAFALGVQSVNPEAVVYVKNLKSWFDPNSETANAEALLNMGCTVIAQHCDTANPQKAAEKAAKEAEAKAAKEAGVSESAVRMEIMPESEGASSGDMHSHRLRRFEDDSDTENPHVITGRDRDLLTLSVRSEKYIDTISLTHSLLEIDNESLCIFLFNIIDGVMAFSEARIGIPFAWASKAERLSPSNIEGKQNKSKALSQP